MAKEDRSSHGKDMEVCEMQRAEHILSLLGQKSKQKPDFVFRRLYRHLYNTEIYAYTLEKRSIRNRAHMMSQIDQLIMELKAERCDWSNPLKIQLLEYAISALLQAIYQPFALPNSKKTLQEALISIQSTLPPFGWLIEMPSIDYFQQIELDRFCFILKQKIDDGRLLKCLRHLIQCRGWSIDWLNILLQELDQWIACWKHKVTYIRYDGHIFLLVKGPKACAKSLWEQMNRFIMQRFALQNFKRHSHLRLFSKSRFTFYDYELKTVENKRIGLFIPKAKVNKWLRPFQKNGKPAAFSSRIHKPIEQIIDLYRRERIDFEAFCSMAWNRQKQIRFFRYVHFYSLLKTIAHKKNISVKLVRETYRKPLKRYLT